MWPGGYEWRHAPEACTEDWGWGLKSQLVESCRLKKKGDCRLLAETLWRVPHVLWGWWKSQHRKIVALSLCRKTKGYKIFVPELRSLKYFSCFGIPMLYIYIYIYICLWRFYRHYECFAYRYEYVYFTYSYLARFALLWFILV